MNKQTDYKLEYLGKQDIENGCGSVSEHANLSLCEVRELDRRGCHDEARIVFNKVLSMRLTVCFLLGCDSVLYQELKRLIKEHLDARSL